MGADMITDDFVNRTISLREKVDHYEGETQYIEMTRTRTTAGHASIVARFGGLHVEFCNEGTYEQEARQFAEMLLEICKRPCGLPPTKDLL